MATGSKIELDGNFAATINRLTKEYGADVLKALDDVTEEVAEDATKKLKAESPKRKNKGGKYARGWKYTLEHKRVRVSAVVHGKKGTYNLAHLLEFGHATVNGGRKAKAIPHVAPVEQWVIKEFETRLVNKLERKI